MSTTGGKRSVRVAESIKRELAPLLRQALEEESGDPLVTISNVTLNRDMGIASIYLSVFASDAARADRVFARLRERAGRMRGPLSRRIGLARAPELRFERDESLEFQTRIVEIAREDEARKNVEKS
jgi:ribosome-binding factor A